MLQDLVAQPEIAKWNLQICHHDSPDARGVDVGMLYNPRYFKVENVTNHRLTAVPFRTRDQMCVVGSLLGQRIAVIVNHWPSRLGGQTKSEPNRMAAAALSKEIADSLWQRDPNIGVIIMGDLNDDPMDRSCAEVLGAKRDSKNLGEHGFFNPFWKKLDDGIGTLAYKSAWNTNGTSTAPTFLTRSSSKILKATARDIPSALTLPECSSTATPTTSPPKYCLCERWNAKNNNYSFNK